eukprot:PLAT3085.1.p1 GENE.PLAT3085.1~~PLAT3085.1.p1  ORF type:complete len:124 (-),score=17.72 PLAT3085.1:37-387(-)
MTPFVGSSFWFRAGALSGAIGVVLGAFGAHALRSRIPPERMKTWETGVQYQMYHALAMMLVPWARRPALAGGAFLTGSVLFSGSLYGLVLLDDRRLGPITPLGGVAFIVGWLALAL